MKTIKILIYLCISLALMSCSENASITDTETPFENPFETVGIEHNILLKQLLVETSNYNQEDAIRHVISFTDSKIKSQGLSSNVNLNNEVSDFTIFRNPKKLYNFYKGDIILKGYSTSSEDNDEAVSEDVDREINEVLDLLESQSWELESLLTVMGEREKNIPATLNEQEQLAIYSMYSTLRHSMSYWAPANEGGEGGFDAYNNSVTSQSTKSGDLISGKIKWWKVGAVDLIGAAMGAYSGGIGGALVVGGGASLIAIIMQV